MTPQTQAILRSARIAELHAAANALAAACKRAPVILPRTPSSARDRRLLLLLARERRRSSYLIAELMK